VTAAEDLPFPATVNRFLPFKAKRSVCRFVLVSNELLLNVPRFDVLANYLFEHLPHIACLLCLFFVDEVVIDLAR
jgi:hypothetical protein